MIIINNTTSRCFVSRRAGGHGPKYRKISLIGGSGGGGLLYPTATASIASTASVSVPKLLHDHHRRPAQATYCSRSGPGVYGSHHVVGNHHHGPTVVHCKNQLLGKLLAKKSTGLDGGRNCAGGCGGGKEAKIGGGGCHGRLRLVGPVCCGSCGGYGGVHY